MHWNSLEPTSMRASPSVLWKCGVLVCAMARNPNGRFGKSGGTYPSMQAIGRLGSQGAGCYIAAMPSFLSDGIGIAYEVHGEGMPILCIHGFGSSGKVNWIDTGWVQTLVEAGYQAITFDNRGHGASRKLYDTKLYFAHDMEIDARNLLGHLAI